jgi:hypothetical protein
MRVSQTDLLLTGLIILYVAFYTNPTPVFIQTILESPVGNVLVLLGLLYVLAYQSFIVGIFLGIAYIMSVKRVTEYLDPKEQTPTKIPPKTVAPPDVTGMIDSLLKKGDNRLPSIHQKKGTPIEKPADKTVPKAAAENSKVETFSNF